MVGEGVGQCVFVAVHTADQMVAFMSAVRALCSPYPPYPLCPPIKILPS